METAFIGLLGVFIGIVLNEYLRRRSRIENYSNKIFEKRLDAYEGLMIRVHLASEVASEIISNSDLTKQERHDAISEVILNIASFVDDNEFYVDSDLGGHCTALFMGVEDIPEIKDENEKEKAISEYWRQYRNTKRMVLDDSGIAEINRLFKSVNKPKLSSPIIERIRELKAEQARKEKKMR